MTYLNTKQKDQIKQCLYGTLLGLITAWMAFGTAHASVPREGSLKQLTPTVQLATLPLSKYSNVLALKQFAELNAPVQNTNKQISTRNQAK